MRVVVSWRFDPTAEVVVRISRVSSAQEHVVYSDGDNNVRFLPSSEYISIKSTVYYPRLEVFVNLVCMHTLQSWLPWSRSITWEHFMRLAFMCKISYLPDSGTRAAWIRSISLDRIVMGIFHNINHWNLWSPRITLLVCIVMSRSPWLDGAPKQRQRPLTILPKVNHACRFCFSPIFAWLANRCLDGYPFCAEIGFSAEV